MALYGTIFYGGNFYGTGSKDVPRDLKFYRTNVDDVYVFHWGFRFDFITPLLSTFDYELQLDTTPLFNSPNLVQFDSSSAIEFQNGDVRKGFAVPVSTRLDKTEQTWFARVRTVLGFTQSDWSAPLEFIVLQRWTEETTENLIDNLPDLHVYNKQDLKKPVAERSTLLYDIMKMYGTEFDESRLERTLTATNNYISLCRDEQLFQNFGTLFDYRKPQTQEFVEYRECLRNLILASLAGSTIDAIQRITRCFTGVQANINLIRDEDDFFLNVIGPEQPPEAPDGIITQFSVSQTYIPGTLQVIQDGTVLEPGVDFTENLAVPGFDMTVAPGGGTILQAFYTIGTPGDPEPILFDISDQTALTGTITFANSSVNVTAVGGAFLSEVTPGNLITDSTGFALGRVLSVTDNDNLVLSDEWVGADSTGTGFRINFNGAVKLDGEVTFTNGSDNVTGTGSSFTSQLAIGDIITDNDGVELGTVLSIADNENLTLDANWTGSTGANLNARKLIYEDPILWANPTLSHGVIIQINNPGQFILDTGLLETLVKKVLPAHVAVFFEFI